jgi:tRNA pseudouridine13 synthase
MKPPRHVAAQREQLALERSQLTLDHFRRFGDLASGTRRPLLIWPEDLTIQPTSDGLLFEFALPAGAYATVLLREFLKLPVLAEQPAGDEMS